MACCEIREGEKWERGRRMACCEIGERELQREREISRDAAFPILLTIAPSSSRFFLVLPVRYMDSVYSGSGLLHNSAARGMFDRDRKLTGMLRLRSGWAWVYDSASVLETIDERERRTEAKHNRIPRHCDSVAALRRHRDHSAGERNERNRPKDVTQYRRVIEKYQIGE